jgi:hypothetical protein
MSDPSLWTPDDKAFRTIRDDIHRRPDFYEPGMAWLRRRFGEWAAVEATETLNFTASDEQKAGPVPPHFMLAAAFTDLGSGGIRDSLGIYDLDRAKAVLLVTWLLTDPEADRHPLASGFGSWESDGPIPGRCLIGAGLLDDEERRPGWRAMVREAWGAVQPTPVKPDSELREPAGAAVVPDGYYSPTDIAKALNVPGKANAIRMALKRLFDENRLPDGAWMENSNPAKGQAKILFRLSAVRPLLARFESPPA